MGPASIMVWVQVTQALAGIGVDVAHKIGGLIHHAHPELSAAEQKAIYDAIMADDTVRAALAAQASKSEG